MSFGRWWLGIAIGLVALFAATLSPAVNRSVDQTQKTAPNQSLEGITDKSSMAAKEWSATKSKAKKACKTLFGDVALTEQQLLAIREIRRSSQERIKALKSASPSREAMRADLAAIRDETKQKIASILTPDQQAKLNEIRQRWKERRAGKLPYNKAGRSSVAAQ
jgi:Spy/CpxP family protein refolding chaperone